MKQDTYRIRPIIKAGLAVICIVIVAVSLATHEQNRPSVPENVQKQVDAELSNLVGDKGEMTGGWTRNKITKPNGEDREVFAKAVKKRDEEYTLISLEATQVVSGYNYCFLCTVESKGATEYQLLYVYESLGGKVEITDSVTLDQ